MSGDLPNKGQLNDFGLDSSVTDFHLYGLVVGKVFCYHHNGYAPFKNRGIGPGGHDTNALRAFPHWKALSGNSWLQKANAILRAFIRTIL